MKILIKRFTNELIDDVIEFEKNLRIQEPDTYFWEIDETYISNVKQSFEDSNYLNTALSFLAYKGDRVIGRIDASLIYTHFDGTLYEAYLNWICVLKEERHKGVAQKLLDHLKDELRKLKIESLIILTAGNNDATKFYDSIENIKFHRGATIKIK